MVVVALVWIVQIGAILYLAFQRGGMGGFFGRLVERLLFILRSSLSVRILGLGWLGFVLVIGLGTMLHDYGMIAAAGSSAGAQASLLVLVVLLKLLGSLFGFGLGGPDFVFGSAQFATPAHAKEMGLVGSTGIRLGYLGAPQGLLHGRRYAGQTMNRPQRKSQIAGLFAAAGSSANR